VEAAALLREGCSGDRAKREVLRRDARAMAQEVLSSRPDWWAGYLLRGQIAEASGKSNDAIEDYIQAIERGSDDPRLVRRVFGLLYVRQRFDEIDLLTRKLDERGMAPAELKLASAVGAMRRKDYDKAIRLAREI